GWGWFHSLTSVEDTMIQRSRIHLRLFLIPVVPLALVLMAPALGQDKSGRKSAEPDSAALGQAEALIVKLYKGEDLAAKTDQAAARALAAVLFKEAKLTTDDKDLQFAALGQVIQLAVQGGNVNLALSAIEEMGKLFNVDAVDRKRKVLTTAPEKIKTADSA